MKANLNYGNRSVIVEIDDTLAHLSVLVDLVYTDKHNRKLVDDAVDHVLAKYVEIGQVLISPEINHAEHAPLLGFDDDVMDNINLSVR
jgi:hypothetical protein